MTSGGGSGGGRGSDFLRFFEFDLRWGMLLELGSETSGNGGILGAAAWTLTGGGESEGREDGGE